VREGRAADRQDGREISHWDGLEVGAGDYLLDVGAHIGALSAQAARAGARVRAYEAHPDNYSVLVRNLQGHPNAEAVWAAVVADPSDAVYLYLARGKSTMSHSITAVKGRQKLAVPAVTLEQALDQPFTVVKIDVEGAEHELGLARLVYPRSVRAVGIDIGLPCQARKRDWWGPSATAICENLERQGFSTSMSREWDDYTELRGSPSGAYFTWAEAHMVYTREPAP
jgi:FkbM family methyltransferase